jgi:ectoine hydroxylase-related dioxygenase (phytanoyl-CoA dioxygenase family)
MIADPLRSMPILPHSEPHAFAVKAEAIANAIRRAGYVILPHLLDRSYTSSLSKAVEGLFKYTGRNEFEGYHTQRVYSLVTQTRCADAFLTHPLLLEVIENLLDDRPILMRTQGIRLLPGAPAQQYHRDDLCIPIAHSGRTLSVSVMLALSDFTAENGATHVVPDSHLREVSEVEDDVGGAVAASMKPGSVLIMLSQLIHGAGSNTTAKPRTGVFANYCVPWLRALDNHYIPLSKLGLSGISPRMLELLGYDTSTQGGIVYGVVEGRHPLRFFGPPKTATARGL